MVEERREMDKSLVPGDLIRVAERNAEVSGNNIGSVVEGGWFALSAKGEWEAERDGNGGTVLSNGDESLDVGQIFPESFLEKGYRMGVRILVEARIEGPQDIKPPQP